MMSFSSDAAAADVEIRAVLFILLGFAYIDGSVDADERAFIYAFADKIVERRANELFGGDAASRGYAIPRWKSHYYHVISGIEHEIRGHWTESVIEGESQAEFVAAKIKLRCFELIARVTDTNRDALLSSVDELIAADGKVHPREKRFRDELVELLRAAERGKPPEVPEARPKRPSEIAIVIEPARPLPLREADAAFFRSFERYYGEDPTEIVRDAASDIDMMRRVQAKLAERGARGCGKLGTAGSFADFAGQDSFLDGHVQVIPPKSGASYELLVLGDLHGCYSCLKAALLQFDFFAKLDAYRADPQNRPNVMVVFLGDYIDRGLFSFHGVLRTAMRLFLIAPDNVCLLRGNHEHYFEMGGQIVSPVLPAEAIGTIAPVAPRELLAEYMRFFDNLPTILVFGKTVFVHAGIPRQDILSDRLKNLSGLNDADVRLQMVWSDPSDAAFVPLDLQRANARFPFGQAQFRAFMERIGCSLMIRGHERLVEGFRTIYGEPDATLLSLFSSGGIQNEDIPADSNYREVTPMALTVHYDERGTRVIPFPIAYERFSDPAVNGFRAKGPRTDRRGG